MRRLLHVIRALEPGGIELWLVDLLRAQALPGWQMEFLVETTQPGVLEAAVTRHGGIIHRWRGPGGLPFSMAALQRLLRDRGPFTAVHSHVHAFSGVVLSAARRAGVPLRIAHSHCQQEEHTPWRRLYRRAMQRLIETSATLRLAVSGAAATNLFGDGAQAAIIPAARDLRGYGQPLNREASRAALGCAKGDLVVAHVGRLTPEKNQQLLVALAERNPRLRVLIAGEGPLRNELRHPQVQLLGDVRDLRPLFAAADCFAFPSVSEGLGLALVEAQAAGVPCVISDAIPSEAIIIPELVDRVALDDALPAWMTAVERAAQRDRVPDCWQRALATPYHVQRSGELLEAAYAHAG
ncbi:MAG: glycosyltransferase [Acidobacteria bacterium]|nr:glycosyltransferase [Acidobacteriota bacterium]